MKQKKGDFTEALEAIENITNNPSWFREHPHYWALASLPFAYAMACVEVVSKSSEKAGAIYSQIIETWSKPGVKAIYEELFSEIPDSIKEEAKQTMIHPENVFLPDPNKPFKDIEEMFANIEINDELKTDTDNIDCLIKEEKQHIEEVEELVILVLDFIIVGFNRESDITKEAFKVFPSEKLRMKTKQVRYDHLFKQIRGCAISGVATLGSGLGTATGIFKLKEDLRGYAVI